jgi:hypothetical protein
MELVLARPQALRPPELAGAAGFQAIEHPDRAHRTRPRWSNR